MVSVLAASPRSNLATVFGDTFALLAKSRTAQPSGVRRKLGRPSRDAHFRLGLQKAGVPFVAADMPEANEMVVGIMAVIAPAERKMISQCTKAALADAKARCVKLASPKGASHRRGRFQPHAVEAVRQQAKERATTLRSVIDDIKASGITGVRQSVARLLARLAQ
jgi:DNA invertase Pin-like site-specific DNA recombinase